MTHGFPAREGLKVSELHAARLVVMNNPASAGVDSNVPWEWKLPDDFDHVAVLQIGLKVGYIPSDFTPTAPRMQQ